MKKRYITKKLIFIICIFILCLSACRNSDPDGEDNIMNVIHINYFADNKGLLYEDFQQGKAYKCYFDFDSMTNVYFCTKPNCDHKEQYCNSRLAYPYSFIIGNDQYYITQDKEMRDAEDRFISYLNKSDISSTGTKVIAEIDGSVANNVYLKNNTLYFIVERLKFIDGASTYADRWYLYQINLEDSSTKISTLSDEDSIDTYIPYGIINNKMIIFHNNYTQILDPADYGLQGNYEDFVKDTENYNKYVSELMKTYRMEMLSFDLDTEEITKLDLPQPLLVYKDCYYYNRKNDDGLYELVLYNFNRNEEKVIYNSPVRELTPVGDTLFFKEGIEATSKITGEPIIADKVNGKEICYNLLTGELRETTSGLPDKVTMKLVKEYGDYYIILYSDYYGKVGERVGYILKEDYFNDKSKFTLVKPE